MANVNRPSGMQPVRSIISPWNGQVNRYCVPSTDVLRYSIGDIVAVLAGSDANGVPYIQKRATATSGASRGVVVGVDFGPDNLNIAYGPATKTRDYYVSVCDDPNAIFEMTDDGITTANLVTTAVGKNCGFTVANPTGNVPFSATVITSSTIDTTNTLPLKIIGLWNDGGRNVAGAYARWLVRFNIHDLNSASMAGA